MSLYRIVLNENITTYKKLEMKPDGSPSNMIYLLPINLEVVVDVNSKTICSGDTVTFTSSVAPAGDYLYQWYYENTTEDPTIIVSIPGETRSTYTTNNAIHNYNYFVVVYDPTLNSYFTSNKIQMIVISLKTADVSITKTPIGSVCSGTTIQFTATPTNGGSNPTYQWNLIDGSGEYVVGTNSPIYTGNTFSNNDIVYCVMTSNLNCCSINNPATSNYLLVSITEPIIASLNIESTPLSVNEICTICTGDTALFVGNVIPSNLSSTLFNYIWYVNNISQPNLTPNNNYFSGNNFETGDIIRCVMSAGFNNNLSCVTVSGVSNSIEMNVNQKIQTIVQITSIPLPSSEDNVYICQYSGVTFTATPSNSGTYSWYVNNISQLSNSPNNNTYYSNTLSDLDEVKCILTTTGCTLPGTSNTMTVHLIQQTTPTVSIKSNPIPPFCTTGGTITFTATTTGDHVTNYTWQKFVGAHWIDISGAPNSRFYTTGISYLSNLNIRCRTKTLSTCQIVQYANSNIIDVDIAGQHEPTVSITSNPNPPFCSTGGTISFSAVTNESTPIYHWQKAVPIIPRAWNEIIDSTNNPYYTSSIASLSGFTVRCAITGTSECLTTPFAYSNDINILTDGPYLPEIIIYADRTTICTGMTITFSASTMNEGDNPKYNWYLEHFLQLPISVGTNSYIYTGNSFRNNDVVYCVLNSNLGCISNSAVTSNEISLTVNNSDYFSLITSVYPSTGVCYGDEITLSVSVVPGGILGLEYQWRYLETDLIPATWFNLPGETGSTFRTTALYNSIYDVVVTTAEGCIRISDPISITVNEIVTPEIIIQCSENPICVVDEVPTVVYSISYMINQGTNPTFEWWLNNGHSMQLIGTESTLEYIPSDGNIIQCKLTSSNLCSDPQVVWSNQIIMSVIYSTLPLVSITSYPTELTFCTTGETFSFSATTNVEVITYQWQKSLPDLSPPYWYDIVGSPNSRYYSGIVTNSLALYNIRCKITTSGTCLMSTYAYSNSIYIDILGNKPVNVMITANPTGTICSGTTVLFIASPTNGGDSPSYQWKVNSINVGNNSYYYQYIPSNGDTVSCVLTSNISCSTGNPATSNTLTMSVSSNNIVTITIPDGSSICSGNTILIEAVTTNEGTSPHYQWRKYNLLHAGGWENIVGETNSTYQYYPSNGDLIDCVLTSNINCPLNNPAVSNPMQMTVWPVLIPNISIEFGVWRTINGIDVWVRQNNPICQGDLVQFRVYDQINMGNDPHYQWWKSTGGSPFIVGSDVTWYDDWGLNDGDSVYVELTSNAICVNPANVNSNTILMEVNPVVTPTVSIIPTGITICSGQTVTFTAIPVNGGGSPTYKWYVNFILKQSSYSDTLIYYPNNSDSVYCEMISDLTCTTNTAISNISIVTVLPIKLVSIQIESVPKSHLDDSNTYWECDVVNGSSVYFYITSVSGVCEDVLCTDCYVGYTPTPDGRCVKTTTVPATGPTNLQQSVSTTHAWYSDHGSLIFEEGFNINGRSADGTSSTVTGITTSMWKNIAGNLTDGPLNRCGLWTSPPSSNQDVGFTHCINIDVAKTYYVAIGCDNYATIRIDGTNIVVQDPAELNIQFGPDTRVTFMYWFIYPIHLTAGTHVVEMIGHNVSSVATLGAEIYDATKSEIISATDYTEFKANHIIFTTQDMIGEDIQIGSGGLGYTCPDGYSLIMCDGAPYCINISYIDCGATP